MGHGPPTVARFSAHLLPFQRVATDRSIDRPGLPGDEAVHQRDVTAGNRMHLKLFGKPQMTDVIFGRHHHPGGLLVETVNDAGTEFTANSCEILAMMEKGIDQGSVTVSRRRVDDETGRFIDDDKMGIFVKDLQRKFLRNDVCRLCRRKVDANRLPPL